MSSLIILMCLIFFTASLSMLVWTRKKISVFEKRLRLLSGSSRLSDEISALSAGSIGLGDRFLKVEKGLQTLNNRFNEIQSQVDSKSPYGQAIIMAQRGSSAEDIVDICGISPNEAALLIMMHRARKVA
ncbi:MAG: DUF2802 domain-containing protein [Gammaproteobacteria bacterium]|nr:DUF2802 domain-containing protein [Gammaproteobacteria bacterium]